MTPQLMNKFWMECRIWNSSASVLSEWRRFGRQPIMFTELLNVLRWNFGSTTCYYEMSISRRLENGVANDSYFGIIDFSTRQIVFEMWTYRQCLNSGSFFLLFRFTYFKPIINFSEFLVFSSSYVWWQKYVKSNEFRRSAKLSNF